MGGFAQLSNACELLEDSIQYALMRAVNFSSSETASRGVQVWENSIIDQLNKMKLLNSKAILLNSTMNRAELSDFSHLNVDEAANNLNVATENYIRWNNAFQTKAMSKAVHYYFHHGDEDKKIMLKELLLKLSDLDGILNNLNETEERKLEQSNVAALKWKETSNSWSKKKRQLEDLNQSSNNSDSFDNHKMKLQEMISKIEMMKNVQGRLLGACASYDWMRDPAKLEEQLAFTRTPPYSMDDFI